MKNENTQHTPGNWIVTGENKNHVSVGTGHFIADCSVFKRAGLMLLLEEQQANAKLIASAPELLEALKETSRYFVKRSGKGKMAKRVEALVNSAIAKAEGKTLGVS